eukprot:c9973_g2_i1.p1 GENE.c9973_g2_i1~~c9973_g2_i1.p1  ORF type:complete len:489 (-),score=79.21 c9973_g2_i1:161-1498(-)
MNDENDELKHKLKLQSRGFDTWVELLKNVKTTDELNEISRDLDLLEVAKDPKSDFAPPDKSDWGSESNRNTVQSDFEHKPIPYQVPTSLVRLEGTDQSMSRIRNTFVHTRQTTIFNLMNDVTEDVVHTEAEVMFLQRLQLGRRICVWCTRLSNFNEVQLRSLLAACLQPLLESMGLKLFREAPVFLKTSRFSAYGMIDFVIANQVNQRPLLTIEVKVHPSGKRDFAQAAFQMLGVICSQHGDWNFDKLEQLEHRVYGMLWNGSAHMLLAVHTENVQWHYGCAQSDILFLNTIKKVVAECERTTHDPIPLQPNTILVAQNMKRSSFPITATAPHRDRDDRDRDRDRDRDGGDDGDGGPEKQRATRSGIRKEQQQQQSQTTQSRSQMKSKKKRPSAQYDYVPYYVNVPRPKWADKAIPMQLVAKMMYANEEEEEEVRRYSIHRFMGE